MLNYLVGLSVLSLVSVGAGSGTASPSGTGGAEDAFVSLEERLLRAEVIQLRFEVRATGAVDVDLRGRLEISGDRVDLAAKGRFVDREVDLVLQARGAEYEFGNRADVTRAETPPHLREALIIGFTRMGILHNLARLTGNAPPDHADGGVRQWVKVGSFTSTASDSMTASFGITVSAQPAGSASLTLTPSGVPKLRRQTVQFPSGEMDVVERYAEASIEP